MSLERETKICKHTIPQVRLIGEDDKESAKVMKFFLDDSASLCKLP
jgi:hypothetical protein